MGPRSGGGARGGPPGLIVTADDYGYAPGYDAGILEAARAGAVDAVSVMVLRGPDAEPLLATGVEIGLHLEIDAPDGEEVDPVRAFDDQLARFVALFGAAPAYLDGHRHCHATGPHAGEIAGRAAAAGLPVRSVDPAHRQILRAAGVRTPERLIGRFREADDPMPVEIGALLAGEELPPGVTEWFVHPGHPDPASGSSYDAGRGVDLELLLRLAEEPRLRGARCSYGSAFRCGP